MQRLQNNAGEIIAPLVGGWAVKETRVLGKYSGIAGDILVGLGIGVGAKAVLDPPMEKDGSDQPGGDIQVVTLTPNRETREIVQPIEGTETGTNPYI